MIFSMCGLMMKVISQQLVGNNFFMENCDRLSLVIRKPVFGGLQQGKPLLSQGLGISVVATLGIVLSR